MEFQELAKLSVTSYQNLKEKRQKSTREVRSITKSFRFFSIAQHPIIKYLRPSNFSKLTIDFKEACP